MENSNFGFALFGLKHFLAFQKASRNLAMSFLVNQKSRRTLATGFREFPKVCCNLVTSFRESMKGCCNLQEAFGKNFQCSLFKQKKPTENCRFVCNIISNNVLSCRPCPPNQMVWQ